MAEWGLKQETIDDVGGMLLPGKTALVMELEEDSTAPVDAAVSRHDGVVHRVPPWS